MADIKSLRDAAKAWAAQEAQDIASGVKKPPMSSIEVAAAAKKASMATHDVPVETDLHDISWKSGEPMGRATLKLQGEGAMKNAIFGTAGVSEDRGRQLAQSVREGRSSVAKMATSTEPKAAAPIEAGKPAEIVTDTGEQAGATTAGAKYGGTRAAGFESRTPKDLGRVTTKVLRGEYGAISPKTASQVSESFASRAASSIGRGIGDTLGAYGAASLAAKAASAYQGMKQGQAVNPATLETSPMKKGKKYLTPTGPQSGDVLGAGESM